MLTVLRDGADSTTRVKLDFSPACICDKSSGKSTGPGMTRKRRHALLMNCIFALHRIWRGDPWKAPRHFYFQPNGEVHLDFVARLRCLHNQRASKSNLVRFERTFPLQLLREWLTLLAIKIERCE
ncbi:hypothetical protein HUU05_10170 [candidate division KSB1 bacterium]|nr:hypothetical protein [candidate division KSB1 bacterium]